jgi:hypothetical protein
MSRISIWRQRITWDLCRTSSCLAATEPTDACGSRKWKVEALESQDQQTLPTRRFRIVVALAYPALKRASGARWIDDCIRTSTPFQHAMRHLCRERNNGHQAYCKQTN